MERARRPAGQPRATAGRHRDDLQGLRAVAVLLVVFAHVGVRGLQGGFVGVDVFFVLSGFLITRLLLNEARRRASVSIAGFYVRRARRILPAAALTLVTTLVVADHLLNLVRVKQLVWDSIAASFFVANVHFAQAGTDYFARGTPPSPDQHFWSLAVEEQFYLVWPALLGLVLFGLALRGRRRPRAVTDGSLRRLLIVVAIAALASLAWSVRYTASVPAAAYFSTPARAWELALGAAIAIATSGAGVVGLGTRAVHVAERSRAALGWVGLAAIVLAGVAFTGATPFPGLAAVLPTAGAALVIASGTGTAQPRWAVGRVLSLAPLRYVGDRSYALYLWHWPVLTLAVARAGHELSTGVKLLLALAAFGISIVTYRTFEDPIRRSRWRPATTALLWPCSVLSVIIAAAFVLESVYGEAYRLDAPAAVKTSPFGAPGASAADKRQSRAALAASAAGRPLPGVVASVRAAQRGAALPTGLTPPVDQLLDASSLFLFPSGCTPANDNASTSRVCTLGDASAHRTLAVLGDSHAEMWMPTILDMAQRDGWAVRPLVKSACTPIDWSGPQGSPACHAWYRWAVGQIRRLQPDVAVITGDYSEAGPSDGSASAVERTFGDLVGRLQRSAGRVVLVGNDPGVGQEPVDCLLSRQASMARCTTTWPAERFAVNDDLAALAPIQRFGFIDTAGWFCVARACPMVIGRTIAYRDTNHITRAYALELDAPFRAAFRRAAQPERSG